MVLGVILKPLPHLSLFDLFCKFILHHSVARALLAGKFATAVKE